MSIFNKLFGFSNKKIYENIISTKENLVRLEILTNELNKKEKENKSHDAFVSMAMESLDEPAWGKDMNGKFVFVNDAGIRKILKTTPEEALNLTDEDFKNDALAQVCMKSDKIVLESNMTYRFIEHARYKNGNDMWIDTTKSPWIIDGEVYGTVGYGKDITKFIPLNIRERYKESGSIRISLDTLYCEKTIGDLIIKNAEI